MAMACRKAKAYASTFKTPSIDSADEKVFKDGDFVINSFFFKTPWMKDKNKIPEIHEEELERIKKFAEENDLKICYYYGFTGFEQYDIDNPPSDFVLVRKYTHPKDWKERIRKFLPWKEEVIYVGNHYFGSEYPKLFENFGREVFDLKTGAEKELN